MSLENVPDPDSYAQPPRRRQVLQETMSRCRCQRHPSRWHTKSTSEVQLFRQRDVSRSARRRHLSTRSRSLYLTSAATARRRGCSTRVESGRLGWPSPSPWTRRCETTSSACPAQALRQCFPCWQAARMQRGSQPEQRPTAAVVRAPWMHSLPGQV